MPMSPSLILRWLFVVASVLALLWFFVTYW